MTTVEMITLLLFFVSGGFFTGAVFVWLIERFDPQPQRGRRELL